MWTSQQKDALWKKWCEDDHLDDIVRCERIASEAVSLFLARASGQAREDVAELRATTDHSWGQSDAQNAADRASLDRLSALAQEAESLRAKVAETEESRDYAREMAGALKASLDSARAEVERLKDERAELQGQVTRRETEIGELEDRLTSARSEVERLTREHRNCAHDLHTAQEWGRARQAEVEILKAENAELQMPPIISTSRTREESEMEWTNEAVEQAWAAWRKRSEPHVPEKALDDAMRRVMTFAVELVAARGGTMTAGQIASMFKALGGDDERAWSDTQRWCSTEVGPLIQHARAQGATVATLQERLATLERVLAKAQGGEKEDGILISALQARVQHLVTQVSGLEEDNDTVIDVLDIPPEGESIPDGVRRVVAERAALQAKVAELEDDLATTREDVTTNQRIIAEEVQKRMDAEMARDAARAEVERLKAPLPTELLTAVEAWLSTNRLSPERVRHGLFPLGMVKRWVERAETAESRLAAIRERGKSIKPDDEAPSAVRWVLEGDAPGHPERVKALSAGVMSTSDGVLSSKAERVKAQSVAVTRAALGLDAKCYAPRHINCPCGWDPPQTCHYPTPDGEPTEAAWKEARELQKAYDRGAEAMRAACLEAIQDVLARWAVPPRCYNEAKSAIEGAAP
jgi:predicted  nucleic acid-binding Zn-ribbon protein